MPQINLPDWFQTLGGSHTGDVWEVLNQLGYNNFGGSDIGGNLPGGGAIPIPEKAEGGSNPGETGAGGGGSVANPSWINKNLGWLGLIAGIGTDLIGSKIASGAATKAAETQAGAAETAAGATTEAAKYQADKILQAASQANSLQELQYLLGREDTAPYREVGGGALLTLKDLLQPEGYLAQAAPQFQFDVNKVSQDPGYDFALKEGQKALERSAAARGNLLSGATGKALERYGQDYATTKVNDVYNRNLSTYNTNYNTEQANRSNLFNRLSSLAGTGQQASTATAGLGANMAGNIGSNTMNAATNAANLGMSGTNASQDYLTSAAAARASGYVGGANAWGGSLGNIGQYLTLAQLLKQQP